MSDTTTLTVEKPDQAILVEAADRKYAFVEMMKIDSPCSNG